MWAGPRSTIKKIARLAPAIRRRARDAGAGVKGAHPRRALPRGDQPRGRDRPDQVSGERGHPLFQHELHHRAFVVRWAAASSRYALTPATRRGACDADEAQPRSTAAGRASRPTSSLRSCEFADLAWRPPRAGLKHGRASLSVVGELHLQFFTIVGRRAQPTGPQHFRSALKEWP